MLPRIRDHGFCKESCSITFIEVESHFAARKNHLSRSIRFQKDRPSKIGCGKPEKLFNFGNCQGSQEYSEAFFNY